MFNYGGHSGYSGMQNEYMSRLQQLQSIQQMNTPQYNTPNQFQPQAQQQNTMMQVGSIEEVKAFNGYFDGQPHYFIDLANNKIYCKQLGNNGMPNIVAYSPIVEVDNSNEGYCTREEYNALRQEFEGYRNVLDGLLQQLGGSVENEQPNA